MKTFNSKMKVVKCDQQKRHCCYGVRERLLGEVVVGVDVRRKEGEDKGIERERKRMGGRRRKRE